MEYKVLNKKHTKLHNKKRYFALLSHVTFDMTS